MTFMRNVLLLGVLWSVVWGTTLATAVEPATDLRPRFRPKVLRYDVKRDEFVYSKGVFNTPPIDRPGPDINFYGNRLSQFKFIGPPSRSGIYGAMDDYKARRQLDPIKYQYRWR